MGTAAPRALPALSPRRWALWSNPPRVLAHVLLVDLAAVVAVALGVVVSDVGRADVAHLAVLAAIAVLSGEAGRRIERRREIAAEGTSYVTMQQVWVFAGLLVLPPVLLAALVAGTFVHVRVRVLDRIVVHRWVFSASTFVLAAAAAAGVLELLGDYPRGLADGPVQLLAVLLAGLTYWSVNAALVVAAIRLSAPGTRTRDALGDPGEQLVMAVTIALGAALAGLLVTLPWLVAVLAGAVLVLQLVLLPHIDQLRTAARTDPKTGLANSVYWFQIARNELARAERRGTAVGVLVLDLDHFKRVNDVHGHLAGDDVLRAVATLLEREVRKYDLAGRFGGEEFAVLLPAVDGAAELLGIADRLRGAVEALRVPVSGRGRSGDEVRGLTASIGAALHPGHGTDVDDLVLAADGACYEAKSAGRNRVVLARGPARVLPVRPAEPAGDAA